MANDLKNLVKKVFEIDSYKSKIDDDQDVVVLSFTVDHEDAAKDLENFIEMGYDFVLDADTSPGETENGTYIVFVELERGRKVAEQIYEILEGIKKLSGLEELRFRYYKSFKSQPASIENLKSEVPADKNSYFLSTKQNSLNNFSNFFSNSYANDLNVIDESIEFKREYAQAVKFNIITSGPKDYVYNSIKGPIMLESKDISEVIFYTKYIGNYNITKINNVFIFENNGWAVALRK